MDVPVGKCKFGFTKMSTFYVFVFSAMTSDIRELWGRADCVCFDVDSTVSRQEMVDELARFSGKYEQVGWRPYYDSLSV